jgi:hypothetical protein
MQITTIGLDLAKNVFQAHGATATGAVGFRKKLLRIRFGKVCKGIATFRGPPLVDRSCGKSLNQIS